MSANQASAAGLITVASTHDAAETGQRLEKTLAQKGVNLFAKIDHSAAARQVGMTLRPTLLFIFGNPQAGTPLMQSKQTIGIDLPLKVLVWEDEAGKTWLTYNQPAFLANRHQIHDREETVRALQGGLEALVRAATAP